MTAEGRRAIDAYLEGTGQLGGHYCPFIEPTVREDLAEKRWREWGTSPEDQREMQRAIEAAGGLDED